MSSSLSRTAFRATMFGGVTALSLGLSTAFANACYVGVYQGNKLMAWGEMGYEWNVKSGGRLLPPKGELSKHEVVLRFTRANPTLKSISALATECKKVARAAAEFAERKHGGNFTAKWELGSCPINGPAPKTAQEKQVYDELDRQRKVLCNRKHTVG